MSERNSILSSFYLVLIALFCVLSPSPTFALPTEEELKKAADSLNSGSAETSPLPAAEPLNQELAPHRVAQVQQDANPPYDSSRPSEEIDENENPASMPQAEAEDAELSQFRPQEGGLLGYQHELEAYTRDHEPRLSDARVRLRPMDEIMTLEKAFVHTVNFEFDAYYNGDRACFERHIRRGLIGVVRDEKGNIFSYRDIYPASVYEDPECAKAPASQEQAAAPSTEDNTEVQAEQSEALQNPAVNSTEKNRLEALVKRYERLEANALDESRPAGTKIWDKRFWSKPTGPKLIIGKYNSGVQWKTRRGQANDVPIVFAKLPVKLNQGLDSARYSKALDVYTSRILIDRTSRLFVMGVNEENEVESVFYNPRVKMFKGFKPNLKEYWSHWWQAKAVRTTPERMKLAVISSLIQFGSGVGLTLLFQPNKFSWVPSIANGLFALLICSHSGMYERIVKTGNAVWETFKRLLIGLPLGFFVAAINHTPRWWEVFTDPKVYIMVLIIGYMDRLASTFMNRVPRMRSDAGLNTGRYFIRFPIPILPKWKGFTSWGFPKIQLFRLSERRFDTGMPRDDTEREIPAVIRNVPKFIGYLLDTGKSMVPAGTLALLATIPPAELFAYFYARANKDSHPKIWQEYEKRRSQWNLKAKAEKVYEAFQDFKGFFQDLAGERGNARVDSFRRRCGYNLGLISSHAGLGGSSRAAAE